jgi:hypothetical protein
MTTKQIGKHRNQQPEPHDEKEYRQGVHQEIAIGETFLKEKHCASPLSRQLVRTKKAPSRAALG